MADDEMQKLLQSVAHMCIQSVEKSLRLQEKFGQEDLTVDQKNENITKMRVFLTRMSANIKHYQEDFEIIADKYVTKHEDTTTDNTENLIKTEGLSRLGLIKTRPDSEEEYDIDLTDAETYYEVKSESGTIILDDDDDQEDEEAAESLKAIKEECDTIALRQEQRAEETSKENGDLLKVMMELPVKQDCDVENAFRFMDDLEVSSTTSGETIIYSADDYGSVELSDGRGIDQNDDHSSSSTIHEAKLDALQNSKNLIIEIKRLDHMDDKEIDRLCNLNNLKKRKLCKSLKRLKRYKRIRLETSDRSSSDTSDTDENCNKLTIGSNKGSSSDLTMSDIDEVSFNNNNNNDNNNVNSKDILAEAFLKEALTDSTKESDSDESAMCDSDKIKPKKLKSRKIDNRNRTRKRYSPLPAIPTDSSNSSSDFSDNTNNKEDQRRKDNEQQLEDITIIEDSNTSSSVEFLDDDDSDLEFITPEESAGLMNTSGRKDIRRILPDSELAESTQQARLEESQRVQRLEELAKIKEPLCSQHDRLILDMDVETKSPLVVIHDGLYQKLKPHQKDGIKFMWEACYESIDAINKGASGSGCILAHCMGLGKTFQSITLIHTVLTHDIVKTKHVLVICPLSTVLNWKNEFHLAFQLLKKPPNYGIYYVVKESLKERYNLIEKWQKGGGVLVMGYDAFVRLICHKTDKIDDVLVNSKKYLMDPGPDLVICDEGHLLKNQKAKRTEALMSIKTNRKIVLTGTPLQNNLKEYYYMVQFVKPGILGTFSEYTNLFLNPIMNGQFHDSTYSDTKKMKQRTHVLNKLLKKTIHRAESSILKQYLPPILDYTIFIKLEQIQIQLYKKYVNSVRGEKERQFFKDYRILQYLCLHPYVIELVNKQNKKNRKERETLTVEGDVDVDNIPSDWWSNDVINDLSKRLDYGSKMQIIFSIIDECEVVGDKVLIFSTSLLELDCIEHFLTTCGTKNRSVWIKNVHYFRLDGEVSPTIRITLCNRFNSPTNKTKVFLISQKVGGLGLNLIAANRVILVSTNFNPGYDTQSVYRIYRFGQNRKCYVYRLVTMGTMEEKIYQRCVVKLALAGTVIDKFHIARHIARHDFFNTMYNLDTENYGIRPVPNVPNDRILAKLIQSIDNIYKYNEYQALLENRPEEELNDEEKKSAWEEYNKEENAKTIVPNNSQVILNENEVQNKSRSRYVTRSLFLWNPATNAVHPLQAAQNGKPKYNQLPSDSLLEAFRRGYNPNGIDLSALPSTSSNIQFSRPSVVPTNRPNILSKSAPKRLQNNTLAVSTSGVQSNPLSSNNGRQQNLGLNQSHGRLQNNFVFSNRELDLSTSNGRLLNNNSNNREANQRPVLGAQNQPNASAQNSTNAGGFFLRDKRDPLLNKLYK